MDLLSNFDREMPVHFAYGYGDYVRTTCASGVSDANEGQVIWSDGHGNFRVVKDESLIADFEKDNLFTAVVLNLW
jgi:hypothetical protein